MARKGLTPEELADQDVRQLQQHGGQPGGRVVAPASTQQTAAPARPAGQGMPPGRGGERSARRQPSRRSG